MIDVEQTKKDIKEFGPWFHNLHLPNGIKTAPNHFLGDFPSFKWRQLKDHIPAVGGVDLLHFTSPLGVLGRIFNAIYLSRYMKNFMKRRNAA